MTIHLDHLVIRHGDFTLTIDAEFESSRIGIYGPSGAGKTTLLQMMTGLLRPLQGRFVLAQETVDDAAKKIHIPPSRRGVGFVPQDDTLFPHLDVRQNVAFGLRGEFTEDAERVVRMMQIETLLDRRPQTLSGGERRRVAIARALVVRPRLLLLDEPLSGLDSRRRAATLDLISNLHAQTKTPFVLVSHHLDELARLCDEILELDEGRIVWRGSSSDLPR